MTYIQPAKNVFFDTDGSVLQNGSVYIGQPDQDPRTNQKTVTFTDAGGSSFTASQPLSVLNGRISYNGRPIVAEVDGEHSILVLNSNGTQIDYTPSIVPPATSGGASIDGILYGLTLADVKALDVAVGDVVRSVGSLTATDSLGADWLVISATGSPGDDVDTIDFDNGLQGRRDKSKLYNNTVLPFVANQTFNPDSATSVWTGSTTAVAASALSDNGPGFYIVVASSAQYLLYAQKQLTTYGAGEIIVGTSITDVSSLGTTPTSFAFSSNCLVYRGLADQFTVEQSEITFSNDATKFIDFATSNISITAIYKV